MYISPPPGVTAHAFDIKIDVGHLRIGLKGNPPFLDVRGRMRGEGEGEGKARCGAERPSGSAGGGLTCPMWVCGRGCWGLGPGLWRCVEGVGGGMGEGVFVQRVSALGTRARELRCWLWVCGCSLCARPTSQQDLASEVIVGESYWMLGASGARVFWRGKGVVCVCVQMALVRR